MIVRDIEDIKGTDKEIHAKDGQWTSRRMLLKDEGMGFSFHETIIKANTTTHIHYRNHLEAVYCVGGNGEVYDIKNDKTYKIYDGIMYALNKHDDHYLKGGSEDMRLICVFNPPLKGTENHDKNGVYPLEK